MNATRKAKNIFLSLRLIKPFLLLLSQLHLHHDNFNNAPRSSVAADMTAGEVFQLLLFTLQAHTLKKKPQFPLNSFQGSSRSLTE